MLKVGYARLDVTPPLGSPLAGYYYHRISDGVLDPIELVALAAHDGENTVLIITGDFLGIMEEWATEIRMMISEETGVKADHVYIQALHQHTSVRIGYKTPRYDKTEIGKFTDEAYYDILYRKFVDVSKMAMDDMCEAEMSVAEQKTAEDISFVRRYRMKDGSVRTNPGRKNVDLVECPMGEADNMVRLVRFKREGAKDIALVNFSTHPDVIGGTKFSADWPGFVRRMTEADIPNVHCILVNGAQGDTNHVNLLGASSGLSRYDRSARMGRIITDTVIDIWDKTEKREASKVSGQIQVKYIPTNTSRIDEIERCKQLKKEYEEGTFIPESMAERADIFRAAALYDQTLFQKVLISVINIGEVAFIGFGGEPFTQYATDAREVAPERFVITTCNTNGNAGYLPTKEAFEEGGYEGKGTTFTIGLVDALQQAIREMLSDE